ncbi:MAG: TIGR03087 family PEP-CTERM/XrtA system glycosyltransferase [Nitrospirae bacterium]|nr:MAG: TIGR03087 family PEP-CTERM/XrtA system glycosyltransferase [Nitrospirota bacterium]
MNILFACHRFPYPPNRGGKIRPYHMIRALSRQHRVTVLTLAESQEELNAGARLRDYCADIMAELMPPIRRWFKAYAALPTFYPSSVAYFDCAALRARVTQLIQTQRFDAIVVHCAFVAPYVAAVRAKRKILDFGDLDSQKWAEYGRHRSIPLRYGYALEAWKLLRFEKRMAKCFDHCTVTTHGEMADFHRLGIGSSCSVIPNGVDFEYFRDVEAQGLERPGSKIVFLGKMDYFPNIDGVLFFANEVFPRIRTMVPDAEFLIVGADPVPAVRELGSRPGITVTGFVPDVRPYLREATLSVAPLRIARGTQNKILEAMAMGVPVVTTSQAAKGIQATPDRHFLVADAPTEFATCVLDLLHDDEMRRRLAREARWQIEQTHSWDRSMELLEELLHKPSC